jgi:hypothetical protein
MKKLQTYKPDNGKKDTNLFNEYLIGKDIQKLKKSELINLMMGEILFFDLNNFYPLIGKLFSEMGFKINITRDGDTNNRADAMIIDPEYSIPIEIKSPTEVQNVNIKSVRQALENKIILLSRKFYPTDVTTTSLSVGYNYPENRSGVAELIQDFYKTYALNVGYIDTKDLLEIYWDKIYLNKHFKPENIRTLRGKYFEKADT